MENFEFNCRWHFAVKNGGIDYGPNDAMGDTFKKLPYSALVRESIQNSLDAASGDGPVTVSFKHKVFDTRRFPELFKLRENIIACMKMYKTDDAYKRFQPMLDCIDEALNLDTVRYLEVSDENTTGMSYTKGSTKSPFYAFVKSIGNSVKSNQSKGGSHGFGKAAYFNASKLRTVLISSLTQDGKYAFEGVVGLCTHEFKGQKREHYGFYTDGDEANEEPVTDPNFIPNRFRRDIPGTSAFIIGVDHTEKGKERMIKLIMESVIQNFWMAILDKKLVVKLTVNNKTLIINAENLFQCAEQFFPEKEDSKTGHTNPRPYMDAFHRAKADFNHLKFEAVKPTLGKVEFYLYRTKTGTDTYLCMRSPMMLVRPVKNRTSYGFYGVFLCRDKRGNEILRTMENARHDQWDYKNCDDKTDREKAKAAEAEMKEFIDDCISQVFQSNKKKFLTFGGLEEFLSIPSALEGEDGFEGEELTEDFGEPDGSTQEDDNGSPTTDIDFTEKVSGNEHETIGQVVIKESAGSKSATGGGKGNRGEGGAGGSDGGSGGSRSGGESGGESGGGNGDEKDPFGKRGSQGGSQGGAGGTGAGFEAGEGPNTRYTRLQVRYRTFAQECAGGGYSHRLVLNSNRDAENVSIIVKCSGEVSDEAIALKTCDKGTFSGNVISNLQLQEGRNVIDVWFEDDMRHSITLTVNEE